MEQSENGSGSEPEFRAPRRTSTWLDTKDTPPVVADFLDYYNVAYEHYKALAATAEKRINAALEDKKEKENIQPFKTYSRAKDPKSLRQKLIMRHVEKRYKDKNAIIEDIVDLAGVRVVLYMPSEEEKHKVTGVLQSIAGESMYTKYHTGPTIPPLAEENENSHDPGRNMTYRPRYGYRATHHRIEMMPTSDNEEHHYNSRDWMVEIQVVSAFTHAWAEVSHDMLYKTHAFGQPTRQEEQAFDALHGLVESGELLLEQSYEAFLKRTYGTWKYRDELEAYLREVDILRDVRNRPDFDTGGLDVLFGFLVEEKKNSPIAVRTMLLELGLPETTKLKAIIDEFEPAITPATGMMTIICLVCHMLRKRRSRHNTTAGTAILSSAGNGSTAYVQLDAVHTSITEVAPSQQCRIMMSALCFLQRALGPSRALKYLKGLELRPEQNNSIDFVLESPHRQVIMSGDSDQDTDRRSLESAWMWFQEQTELPKSICGLAFCLAQVGPMKDMDAKTLLEKLTIRTFGTLSRSSTFSNDDDDRDS